MQDNPNLPLPSEGESTIELFQRQRIRRVFHDGEWWYAIVDVIARLTDSVDPAGYLRDMRRRDSALNEGWGQFATPLEVETSRGKQKVNCANIESLFRILQSVPSKKAEPFKKWLAKNAFERLKEIENPELALKRAIHLYRAKGYDDDWIDARIRNKASRVALTAEWDKRGMRYNIAILSDAISIETFGLGVNRHKEVKGLAKHHSLRDNMTPIELTLTTLGEQATKAISTANSPVTLQQNLDIARRGGRIAGSARKEIETATGQKVVSPKNYLTAKQRENSKREFHQFDDIMKRLLDVPPVQNKDLRS